MSDPDRVLLFADEDCDDDREPVTVQTLEPKFTNYETKPF